MKRWAWVLAVAVIALLLTGATAGAEGDGLMLSPDGLALVRTVTWPGAVVLALFSPVGKALAGLVQAITPSRTAVTVAADPGVGEALRQMAAAMQRQNEVNAETVEALQQIQQGLAILLDRTARAPGQVVGR